MNNVGHRYVKPARSTTAPVRVIVAVPSPQLDHATASEQVRYLRGDRVWCCYLRRRGADWSESGGLDGCTPDQFWRWVTDHCYPRCRTWIIAPSASDLLTLTGWWDRVDDGEWQVFRRDGRSTGELDGEGRPVKPWVGRLVLRGTPDIVTARRGEASVCAVSWANYSDAGFDDLRRWCGLADVQPDPQLTPRGLPRFNVQQQRRILATGFARLVSEWVRGDYGPFRETSPQLVLSVWRRKFLRVRVCRHADETAARLEQAAAHGGRASVWYFGDVGRRSDCPRRPWEPPPRDRGPRIAGPLTRLDVTSQYPTILRDQHFPVRLVGLRGEMPVPELVSWAQYRGIIATVEAEVRCPEYPVRLPRRVVYRWPGEGPRSRKERLDVPVRTVYPVGRVTLTLAGPELARLAREDSIVRVHAAALYDVGKPFGGLMAHLLDLRQQGKDGQEGVIVQLAKKWAVSFGGKFSQRGGTWEPHPDICPPIRWGEYADRDEPSRRSERWRAFAGLAQRWKEGQAGAKLLAAVYAYMTSYARLQMRDLRGKLPVRSVLSQDTDGLWIAGDVPTSLDIALSKVGQVPGSIRRESVNQFGRWYTPRHYYVDGSWVLAGVSHGFSIIDRDKVRYTVYSNPIRQSPREAPNSIAEFHQYVDLRKVGPTEFIGPDGWSVPSRLHGESVVPHAPADAGLFTESA